MNILSYEEWKKEHIRIDPSLIEDFQAMHGLNAEDELKSILEDLYQKYKNSKQEN